MLVKDKKLNKIMLMPFMLKYYGRGLKDQFRPQSQFKCQIRLFCLEIIKTYLNLRLNVEPKLFQIHGYPQTRFKSLNSWSQIKAFDFDSGSDVL